MDAIALYNLERWNTLAREDALFTRPALDLTPETAREAIDPQNLLGAVSGKSVLLLAGGGGQQSAAFALLGANVTVFDLSDAQLGREKVVADHYSVTIETVGGDMRDLSGLPASHFDIVYHPYSLSLVPDAQVVFAEVARVLKPNGIYHFTLLNPFMAGMTFSDWDGESYRLRAPYVQGRTVTTPDASWVFREDQKPISPPQPNIEYVQTLSGILNGLVAKGFTLFHFSDNKDMYPDLNAEPGSWDHFVAYAPPWLSFWLRFTG